jgi:hypothetical protein
MRTFDPRDFSRAMEGMDFPVSKDAVLRTAADKGGLNGDVQSVLELIPEQTYESRASLDEAISAAYIEFEELTAGMPVTVADDAPAAEKDAVAAGAETEHHSAA